MRGALHAAESAVAAELGEQQADDLNHLLAEVGGVELCAGCRHGGNCAVGVRPARAKFSGWNAGYHAAQIRFKPGLPQEGCFRAHRKSYTSCRKLQHPEVTD